MKLENFYKEKVLSVVFLLFPIIELITSLMIVHGAFKITIGAIFKTIIVVFSIIYILFVNKKKEKIYIISLLIIFITMSVSLVVTTDILSISNLIRKIPMVLRFLTFPVMTVFFICYYKNGEKIPIHTLILGTVFYAIVMLIAGWTGSANATYENMSYGHTGWYYSANELGILFSIALPFAMGSVIKNKSFSSIVACILCIYGTLCVGTKARHIKSWLNNICSADTLYNTYYFEEKRVMYYYCFCFHNCYIRSFSYSAGVSCV